MKIKERSLVNIIFFLTLFPYFKVIPIDAEIQPIGAAFAALLLLCFGNRERLTLRYKLYFAIITTYIAIGLVYVLLGGYSSLDFIESAAIIIAPLLIFIALKDRVHLISTKLFMWSMIAWAGVGFAQKYATSILQTTGIDFILGHIISRWRAYDLSATDRGVVMFSPEPSYAAHNIIFMLVFAIFLYKAERISRRTMTFCVFLFCIMVYLNLSSTMLFISILFAVPYIVSLFFNWKTWVLTGIGLTLVYLLLPTLATIALRPVLVMTNMFTQLVSGNMSIFDFEAIYGSSRLGNTFNGYHQLFVNGGLGHGLGSWERLFNGFKPYSYVSFVSSDMGLFGFVGITLIFLQMVLTRIKAKKLTVFSIACLISALFGLYFNSTTSLPLYWVMLLLYYHEPAALRLSSSVEYEEKPTVRSLIKAPVRA